MRTGDILLFRPREGVRKWVLGYTHVGIVVGDQILEAHARGDVTELGNEGGGVFAYDIESRIAAYDGDVYWARLRAPRPPKGTIERIAASFERHEYDHDHVSWLVGTCALGMPLPRRPNVVFCSELVTRILQRAGVVSRGIDPSCMTPDHVAELDAFASPVRLAK